MDVAACQDNDEIYQIIGPEVDWKADVLRPSAWLQHIPFAFWIIAATRPRCLVELGTFYGVSYFAFCQAIERLGVGTKCFAVDTWEGDDHAGTLGKQAYDIVNAVNDKKYQTFSTLMRSTFDAANAYFPDGEIDLLHIDGLHTYEAVSHDFALWKPKLSKRAVVLMHDINVRERGFGVWKCWEELSQQFPNFAMQNGSGLGILGVGSDLPPKLCTLFSSSNKKANQICSLFAARGEAVLNIFRISQYIDKVNEFYVIESQFKNERDVLTKALSDMTHERNIMAHERNIWKNEVFSMQSSRSWRLTEPLRLSKRMLKKAKFYAKLRFSEVRLAAKDKLSRLRMKQNRQDVLDTTEKNRQSLLKALNKKTVIWVGGEPDTPGYQYRVVRQAEAAQAIGVKAIFFRLDETEAHVEDIRNAQAVILWRAAWDERVARLVAMTKEHGVRFVFDIDDLMFDPRLATVKFIDGIRSQAFKEEDVSQFYGRVLQTLQAADLCLTTTEVLAEHIRAMGKGVHIVPNGYDHPAFTKSRLAHRRRASAEEDGLFRIGYAAGSRTHQRDFAVCATAVAQILRDFPRSRLVLFRSGADTPLLDIHEFFDLADVAGQIEWRQMVPVTDLPEELARFDVNLAPLEKDSLFCEAKSELKYFEAALAGVCTIASPSAPFRAAIKHAETGLLAETTQEWYDGLAWLLTNQEERKKMARTALSDVLWTFGPMRRMHLLASFIAQTSGGWAAARAFAFDIFLKKQTRPIQYLPEREIVFLHDALKTADITVIIPLYNYERYIIEALDSVAKQSMDCLDLVVVDDASTDKSQEKVITWASQNKDRFNRLVVVRNKQNAKLGPTRNGGFDLAETPYVFPLDADNLLLPDCLERCLAVIRQTGAAYVYPRIEAFGADSYSMGECSYDAVKFVGGNYIDAMALISKEAWCAVGGYDNVPFGWEDYAFWCSLAEIGLYGVSAGNQSLAKYRVHQKSMLKLQTCIPENFAKMKSYLHDRHPWLAIARDQVAEKLGSEG